MPTTGWWAASFRFCSCEFLPARSTSTFNYAIFCRRPTTSAAEQELQHVDELYEATDAGTRGLGCSDYVANCGHSALDLISVVL